MHRLSDALHNLGFGKGAVWEAHEDALKIYDIGADPPKMMVSLTSDQMHTLVQYWRDGYCPICFAEIPLNDVICDDCLERANSARL